MPSFTGDSAGLIDMYILKIELSWYLGFELFSLRNENFSTFWYKFTEFFKNTISLKLKIKTCKYTDYLPHEHNEHDRITAYII